MKTKTIQKTTTAEILQAMLTENTGIAMCDSGGMADRHWQRNEGRNFEQSKRYTAEKWDDSVIITKSLYHTLNDVLTYAPDMDAKYQQYDKDHPDDSYLETMENFASDVLSEDPDDTLRETGNSANGESALSQEIQYCFFTQGDEQYVLLQIHGGADIRGGYTTPRAFKCDHDELLLSIPDINFSCKCGDAYSDDAGSNWYGDFEDESGKTTFPPNWKIDDDGVIHCTDCKRSVGV